MKRVSVCIFGLALLAFANAMPVDIMEAPMEMNLTKSYGVDLTGDVLPSYWQCFKKNGIQWGVIRAYQSIGKVDTNAPHAMYNALQNGVSMDVYHFPCRSQAADTQIKATIDYLAKFKPYPGGNKEGYNILYIDIETNPSSSCTWAGHSLASNCQFIQQLVDAVGKHGKKAGIYSSKVMWDQIAGAGCKAGANAPLWYPHYDNKDSCSDFSPFGGWSKPSKKQYQGDKTFCNIGVDRNVGC